ncbi:MAG TPA: glycosyltransferase family 39 protein [bacterium]|nr:glycosyltransferase family 39 protein [bacterium]
MRAFKDIVAIVVVVAAVAASLVVFFYYHADHRNTLAILATEASHAFLFAALAWAAYFVGRLAVGFIFRPKEHFWEIDLAVGFVGFGLAAVLLGATHLLYGWIIRVIILVVLGFSAPLFWRYCNEAGDYIHRRFSSLTPGPLIVVAFLVPLAVSMLVRVGLPPFEWDSLVYHLYIPKVYAENHRIVYLPRLAYSSMPLGAEMMYTWAYLWNGLGCAAAVAPLMNGLFAVATWRLARRYLDNLWATVAAAFLVVTPVYALYFASAYVDMTVGALALMALFVYVRGFDGRGDAALAGFLSGAALGVKYTAAYALIGLVPVIGWDLYRRRVSLRRVILMLVVALVVASPWFVKAFVERGNPVFPALYDVFGGRDLSPAVAEHLGVWQKEIGMGREPLDYALLPYRASFRADGGYERFDGIILPFSVVTLLLALAWFRRSRLLLYTAFYGAAWAILASQQLRFLSAALGTLAILAAGVFSSVASRAKGWWRAAVSVVLIGSGVAFGYVINGSATFWYSIYAVEYLFTHDADAYLEKTASAYLADKYINENLPEDAVILMIFQNHLLYLERRAIYDSFFESSETLKDVARLESPAAVANYVDALGVTHVLTGRFADKYFWSHYDPSTRVLWTAYLRGYTYAVFDNGEFEIRVVIPRGRE